MRQVVRDEEAAVGTPGIDPEAAFATHPGHVGAVEYLADEAEAVFEFGLPLFDDRGRRGHDDHLGLAALDQFSSDQAGFDGLAEPRVVGDEEIDAGQQQRLAQRFHLVGVDTDTGPKRGLEQVRVRRGGAVPTQGVVEGGELARRIETLCGEPVEALVFQDAPVELVVPRRP